MGQSGARILNTVEVSNEIFNGRISPWSVGQMVRKKLIPHFRIGRRVFFDEATLRQWAAQQSIASIEPNEPAARGGVRQIR